MISGISAPLVQVIRPPSHSPANLPAERGDSSLIVNATPGKDSRAPGELTEEEKAQVEQFKKVDREVKAHEQAHKNAGGQFAGSASFGYEVGPDGRRYAVSGEVPIDVAPVEGDPEATIAKMTAVAAAALAPAKPSGQDRRVAAQASALRAGALAELAQKTRGELSGEDDKESGTVKSFNISALAAYETGSSAESNEKKPGNILDFFS